MSRYIVSETQELPRHGEVKQDTYGCQYCHICGKSFKKVLAHVWQKHNISAISYKKLFGLYTSKGLLCPESRELAQQRNAENKESVIYNNLIKQGIKTRFKKGCKGRTKNQVSAQLKSALRKRNPLLKGDNKP